MKIGEAAKVSGVSVRSLRFYEAEGLITPGRHGNGYRDYCEASIVRVRTIRFLIESGLPVKLIKEVLPYLAHSHPEGNHDAICPEFLEQVQDYHDQLTERIAALTGQQQALNAFLDTARKAGTTPD